MLKESNKSRFDSVSGNSVLIISHITFRDCRSLVHCAVKGGNTSIIHEPLSRDLDADSRSNDDFTPLMNGAIGDKESAFQMMIQSGADPSLKDNKEFSVLHPAEKGGNTSIINELFLPGLNVDSRDNDSVITDDCR